MMPYAKNLARGKEKVISIILPARNEANSLKLLLPNALSLMPDAEIIVVNDGSEDDTQAVCEQFQVNVISHPYAKGNGAAIKSGARAATGDVLIFMDADGQHRPEDIPALIEKFSEGYDMVVGARQTGSHAGAHRAVANDMFSRFATWMVQQPVEDLTSGFRIVKASKFRKFLYLLPNGFSYPTTCTMAFFRSAYAVAYEPIPVAQRVGRSHIRPLRDGVRFLLIIFKIATLYSPLRLFVPASLLFFLLGFGHYLFTYFVSHRLTNMSVLLFSASVIVFLIGLISEQITALTYRRIE